MKLDDYFDKIYNTYDDLAIYYNKLVSYWERKQFLGRIKNIFHKSITIFIPIYLVSLFIITNFNLYFNTIKSSLLFTTGLFTTPLLIGSLLEISSNFIWKKRLNEINDSKGAKTSFEKELKILKCSVLERCYTTRRNIMINAQKEYNQRKNNNKDNKSNIVFDKLSMDNLEKKLNEKLLELNAIEQKNELLTTKILLDENYLFLDSLKNTFKAGGIFFISSILFFIFLYKTSINGLFKGVDITILWFIGQCLSGIIGNILYNKTLDNKIKAFNYYNKTLGKFGINISKNDFELDKEIMFRREKIIKDAISLLVKINTLNEKIKSYNPDNEKKKLDYRYTITNGIMLNNNDIEDMTYDKSQASYKLVRKAKNKYF